MDDDIRDVVGEHLLEKCTISYVASIQPKPIRPKANETLCSLWIGSYPKSKASMTDTVSPRFSSASAVWEPINPAPPVIITCMISPLITNVFRTVVEIFFRTVSKDIIIFRFTPKPERKTHKSDGVKIPVMNNRTHRLES